MNKDEIKDWIGAPLCSLSICDAKAEQQWHMKIGVSKQIYPSTFPRSSIQQYYTPLKTNTTKNK